MNTEEFRTAFLGGYQRTVRFLRNFGVPYDEVQEVAQAAWTRGFQKREQLKDLSLVVSWVNTIALNLFRRQCRTYRLSEPLDGDFVSHLSSSEDRAIAVVDTERILRVSRRGDAILLRRHHLEGVSSEDIARSEGVTGTSIRIRLLRARRKAREELGIPETNGGAGARRHLEVERLEVQRPKLDSVVAVACYVIRVTEVEFAQLPYDHPAKSLVAYFMRRGGTEIGEIAITCCISEDEARAAILLADMKVGGNPRLRSPSLELVELLSK